MDRSRRFFYANNRFILRIRIRRDRQVVLLSQLARGSHSHPLLRLTHLPQRYIDIIDQAIGHGVIELLNRHGRPGSAEHNIRHEDFVLERGPEGSFGAGTLVFDLPADSGDRLDLHALEPRDLDRRVEHVFDERRVFEDLERMSAHHIIIIIISPDKLQLLHHAERLALLQHRTRRRDAELGRIGRELLHGEQSGVRRNRGTVKHGLAVHVFRRVLDHPQPFVAVLHRVHRHRLEAPPAVGKDQRIVRLQDAPMPAMLLDSHLPEMWKRGTTRIMPSISSLSRSPPRITGISGRARRTKAGETFCKTMRQ